MAANLEWTSEQMIENANNWSLAGDVALLNRLKKFSETLISETVSISANVDNLLNNLENVSLKLDLTKNEFQSLRNTQFIENRVYEDDETMETSENKKEEKELTEEEKEKAIKDVISKGLKIMETYFEKVEVAVSDSEEEENEKSYILQPKDPYADRPLPYLVGTQEWYKKWHVGLLPSESESESEKEDEVYSSSDSEELLPKDRILGSETSSELDFAHKNTGPVANSTFNDSQDRRREVFHSSDESLEQSNSLPAKAPISNENFAEQLAAKLGDVINTTENLESNKNPLKKMSQATKYGNLFSDEPPPIDELDDTVLPKSAHEGLFSGGKDLFAKSTEEDLFWGQQNNDNEKRVEKEATSDRPNTKSKLKANKGLFDQSDSSSEEDMFTVAEKRKTKSFQPYLQPFKPTVPFLDDQPPELTPKNDNGPSKKKPVGGVSIFGGNSNIFCENSGKPGFENNQNTAAAQITQEIESKSANVKKTLKKNSLFDESSDEDIITPTNKSASSKPSQNQPSAKKLSLFDDSDEILPIDTQEPIEKPDEKKKLSLFDDASPPETGRPALKSQEKKTLGLFDDEDPELFKPASKKIAPEVNKIQKKISLFDSDDDFLKEEDDIFANVPKKKGLFDDLGDTTETKPTKGLLENLEDSNTSNKASANEKGQHIKPSKGLSHDLNTDDSLKNVSPTSVVEDGKDKLAKNTPRGLFDDLEASGSSDDLFGGKRASESKENIVKKDTTGTEKDNKKSLFGDIEDTVSKEDLRSEKKGRESLFEDTEETAGEGDLFKNTKGNVEKKLNQNMSVENTKKNILKDSGNSLEKEQLFKDTYNKEDLKSESLEKRSLESEKDVFKDDAAKPKDTRIFKDIQESEDSFNFKKDMDQKTEEKGDVKELRNDGIREKNEEERVVVLSKDDNIDSRKVSDQHTVNITRNAAKEMSAQSRDLIKKRKKVSLLDSDSDSWSDDNGESKEDDVGTSDEKKNKSVTHALPKQESLFKPKLLGADDVEKNDVGGNVAAEEELPPRDNQPLSNSNVPQNYAIPPAIGLFDPTPPPPDPNWDVASDNSGESDTFSLTDGILDRTNFLQSQERFSLFDDAPPSLDVNESSGIVRDLNVTRVETDDSSFYPYASSSRRLSSDIFGEQQSQDNFFVTKNQTEGSTQQASGLEKIPEDAVNVSSKIDNLTPSGNLEDFEGSSVFESNQSESESKDNVKKTAALFEDSKNSDKESVSADKEREKSIVSSIKTSPGKLKHNLQINVGALMPGAPRPKIRPALAKSSSTDETDQSSASNLAPPFVSRVARPKSAIIGDKEVATALSDGGKFDGLSHTEVLTSATKDRARIPVKRRPSTRKARQEAVRKSMTDFSLYQNEQNSLLPEEDGGLSQASLSGSDVKNSFSKDLTKKLSIPDSVSKDETSKLDGGAGKDEDTPEVTGISLVFDRSKAVKDEEILDKSVSKGLFDSFDGDKTETSIENKEIVEKFVSNDPFDSLGRTKTDTSEKSEELFKEPASKGLFDSSLEESDDFFSSKIKEKVGASQATSKFLSSSDEFKQDSSSSSIPSVLTSSVTETVKKTKNKSLFGAENSSGDEDLLKPSKTEQPSTTQDPKPSIFSDLSDSDGEGELFGAKPKVSSVLSKKIVGETSKKASIFDDSGDSSEDDLFGSKKSTSKSESTGSLLVTRRVENKAVKTAGVKKLENKEVTDFDPLSALK